MFGGKVYPTVVWLVPDGSLLLQVGSSIYIHSFETRFECLVWLVHFEEDRAFFYMVFEPLSFGWEFAPAGRKFNLNWA